MSSSQHPVALALQRREGDGTRLLATVMLMPLVDGIFPALVLAGALSTASGIVEIGLLIFAGSATIAVILAEMDGSPIEQVRTVLAIGVVLVTLAVVEAALAPTIRGLIDIAVFERFAAIVILAIAAKTASARVGEWLPRPAVIVGLGLLASLDPAGARLVVRADLELMARAAAAGLVGVGAAAVIALASPWLRNAVDLDRLRFGGAVALGIIPLGLFGLIPGDAPIALAVIVVAGLLAFDPGRARERDEEYRPDDVDVTAAFADGGATQGVSHDDPETEPHPTVDYDPGDDLRSSAEYDGDEDRPPWL